MLPLLTRAGTCPSSGLPACRLGRHAYPVVAGHVNPLRVGRVFRL